MRARFCLLRFLIGARFSFRGETFAATFAIAVIPVRIVFAVLFEHWTPLDTAEAAITLSK